MTETVSSNVTPIQGKPESKQSEAERDFESRCANLLPPTKISEVKKLVEAMIAATHPQFCTITPEMAAYIMQFHNKHNRDLSFSKAKDYGAAMTRGEWKVTHQGIAFYEDGQLADGQHREGGQIFSDTTQTFLVTTNLSKTVIDTVDAVKQRSAGDALQLLGVADPKIKAGIGEKVMSYEWEMVSSKPLRPTVPQVEKFVVDNGDDLSMALDIGRASTEKITDATLGIAEAATAAALLLRGGFSRDQVVGYIAAVQQGVATYEDSPITLLTKKLIKAKVADKKSDRMTTRVKLALLVKAANLWAAAVRVTKLDWKADKEPLPAPAVAQQKAA